jgi:pentalenene oxygenase
VDDQDRRRWLGGPRLLLRTRQARRRRDPGVALRALARGGGDAVGLRLRGRRVLLVLEPRLAGELLNGHAADTVKGPALQRARQMLGDGLLTSEGAAHERARRLVAPAFSPGQLARYAVVFARCAQEQTARWTDGEPVDVDAEMRALTLRVAGQAFLGTDLSAQAPLVRAGLEAALTDFDGPGFGQLGFGRPGSGASGARGSSARGSSARGSSADARAAVHALVDDVIRQRRAAGTAGGGGSAPDALAALLDGGLTDQELHDHVLTLLLAGHETSASALAWTLYLLGRHPGVQRRLRAEARAAGDQPPGPATGASLPYTRAVVSEAIRLYPPAWLIGRTLTADTELGGWRLPAGSVAAVSPLLLHHDPRWFPDPEAFDPGRWLDDRRHAVPRHAYLPFGTGPRACIGEQFAWAETVTVLSVLAQSWTFRPAPGPPPRPGYRLTLRPAAPLPLIPRSATADT